LSWDEIQESATETMLLPSTMHDGDMMLCGSISVLETLASFRPALYAQLVLAVWRDAQVIDHTGKPWINTVSLNAELLEAKPETADSGCSVADWMVASAMIAGTKDLSVSEEELGHDGFFGPDAKGPDGKALTFPPGLTYGWDVEKMLLQLLGCTTTEREIAYWVPRPSITNRMIGLTDQGGLERGEAILLCLISDSTWKRSVSEVIDHTPGHSEPSHWVRVHSVEDAGGDWLNVSIFSFGEPQERMISRNGWSRIYFEAIFATLPPLKA